MFGTIYSSNAIDYQDWLNLKNAEDYLNLKNAGLSAPTELVELTGIVLNAQALSLRFTSLPRAFRDLLPVMRYECWLPEHNIIWHVFVAGSAAIHAERDAINLRQKQDRHNYWGRFALTHVLPEGSVTQYPRPWHTAQATGVADCGSATTPCDPRRVLAGTHHR